MASIWLLSYSYHIKSLEKYEMNIEYGYDISFLELLCWIFQRIHPSFFSLCSFLRFFEFPSKYFWLFFCWLFVWLELFTEISLRALFVQGSGTEAPSRQFICKTSCAFLKVDFKGWVISERGCVLFDLV